MPRRLALCALTFAAALLAPHARAAVTRVEVTERADLPVPGLEHSYERIDGKLHFAVDPKLPANRLVVDLALAPKNSQGLVEFTSDFQVFRPKDASKSNGTALLEVVNRGRSLMWTSFNSGANGAMRTAQDFGDNFLLSQGFTLIWVGWQFDVTPAAGTLTSQLPVVPGITGPVRMEILPNTRQLSEVLPYPMSDVLSGTLTRRDAPDGPRTVLARNQWQYSADSKKVEYASGFEPGRIYEFVYTAYNPVVAGLGMAAIRDTISYVKQHGSALAANSSTNIDIKRTLAYGFSQSGRFLRTFLYDGFNADEQGKPAFDGIWANGAGAGHGGFNQRFAQPGKTTGQFSGSYFPTDQPPFTAAELLTKAASANVAPKLFLSDGSHEYWGRAASLIHTTPDGTKDVDPPANVRIYYIAGTQHGGGTGNANPLVQNPTNSMDLTYFNRATLLAMNAWLTSNTLPPPSQFPRIDKGQLVAPTALRFPAIPNFAMVNYLYAPLHLDFGPDYLTRSIAGHEPAQVIGSYNTLVPQVDVDGNETSGIRLPELRTPLATYTGWNLRHPNIGSPTQQYALIGSMAPFALSRGERDKTGDARLSITERYRGGRADYLTRIEATARELVTQRFLLEADLPRVLALAGRHWDQMAGPTAR